MAVSAAFERNTDKVIDIVDRIPEGRCTTYGAIGEAIGIVPRYVALIMATAPDVHGAAWHRVVGKDATIKPGGHRSEQHRRMQSEGFVFDGDKIVNFDERFWRP